MYRALDAFMRRASMLDGYRTEQDRFFEKPDRFMENYPEAPDYIVMFDNLKTRLVDYLTQHKYRNIASFFHAHFADAPMGQVVQIWKKL